MSFSEWIFFSSLELYTAGKGKAWRNVSMVESVCWHNIRIIVASNGMRDVWNVMMLEIVDGGWM
jgi:hypothetical protein